MIHKIAEKLRDQISTLDYVEVAAGLAKPHAIRNKQEEGVIDQIVPLAYNDLELVCEPGDLLALYPDSKKMSIHWWEDNGSDVEDENAYFYHVVSSLTLVSWWNLPKINSAYTDPSLLVANLISEIPESLTNDDYMIAIQIAFAGEAPSLADILNKYTFDEPEFQFNTHPYYLTGLNYEVRWWMGKSCPDSIVVNPSVC